MSIEAREGSRLEASEPESKPRDFQGKRLLILAGAGQHCKLVDAAKKLGVYTIVCDYLEPSIESPAKLLADECWNISTLDVDAIVAKCKDVQVDGVMSGWNDVAQIPYFEICERLNLPCYGTRNQFETLTDKRLFKQFCKDNNVNVIDEYTQEDVVAGRVEFPVFIKPADGCGSKGQSICSCQKEVQEAIAHAKDYSRSGELLFERYVPDTNSFQVTYFFIDGEPFLIRTADGYKGTREVNLDRVALCSVSPSSFTEEYLERADEAVVEMLKKLGIVDGPVMIQGFYDNGVFRFYDPGLRFPGTDFEVVYKSLFGTDFMEAMVVYAITGELP